MVGTIHKRAAVSINSQSEPVQSGESRRTLKLLVVDDDAVQRMLISSAAKQAGHAVTLASSCTEAITQVQTAQFDCATLDLMLEDGDGLEVLKAMADVKFAGSVIVISGMNAARRVAARSYARSLGIELQSLPKPVDLAALRICFANLCKTAMGLPVMHTWGGIAVDGVAERHRS
jgi:two-component system, chemotaxis family, chemotaxis protein CheY